MAIVLLRAHSRALLSRSVAKHYCLVLSDGTEQVVLGARRQPDVYLARFARVDYPQAVRVVRLYQPDATPNFVTKLLSKPLSFTWWAQDDHSVTFGDVFCQE